MARFGSIPPEFQDFRHDHAPKQSPPTAGLHDWPTRVLCINEEWASFVAGQVERLAHFDVWEGTFAARAAAVDVVEEMLQQLGQEESCMGIMLRQNPDDFCQLLGSYDAGLTWFVVYDYALCQPIPAEGSSSYQYDLELNWNIQIGLIFTPSEVTPPDMVYDASGDDTFRDEALCYALFRWVDMICEAEIQRRQLAVGAFTGIVGLAVILVAAVSSVLSLGTMSLVAYGLLVAVFREGLGTIGGLSLAALQDTDARADVACCMKDNLEGSTPDHTAFQAALASCSPALAGNALVIRTLVQALDGHEEAYTAFALAMVDGFGLAKLEILPGCECDEWSHDFLDGDNDQAEWAILPYDNPSSNECSGTYNGGSDRFDGCNAGSGFSNAIIIEVEIPATRITHIEFTGSGNATRTSSADGHLIHINDALVSFEGFGDTWASQVTDWDGSETVTKIRLKCAAALNSGGGDYSRIEQITISGRGVDPF